MTDGLGRELYRWCHGRHCAELGHVEVDRGVGHGLAVDGEGNFLATVGLGGRLSRFPGS